MPPVTRTMSNKGKRQSSEQPIEQTVTATVKQPTATVTEQPAAQTVTLTAKPLKSRYFGYVSIIPLLSVLVTAYVTIQSSNQSVSHAGKQPLINQFMIISAISIVCYQLTNHLIPILSKFTLKAGMSGVDLNKPKPDTAADPTAQPPRVPEALGLVSGVVYMIAIVVVQLVYSLSTNPSFSLTTEEYTQSVEPINHSFRSELVEMNAALHSICFMLFLGFADDVLELPWRYKLMLPSIASLPLLIAYNGGTHIIVPKPFRHLLPGVLQLGVVYQVYMLLLAVFCTNAINILAGINGLEAGQSFIIACAVAVHNLIEVTSSTSSAQTQAAHLFSLMLILPFIGSTLGLLRHNWYPSRVFVGDTFTTQAGMTFAVCGILGHFSKTLLLFFIPQIINFLMSLPQIIGLFGLTCPRHRLPKYDPKTGKLVGQTINHNLINVLLLVLGPMGEEQLCVLVLAIQAVCCALGFFIRYYVSKFFY